MHETITQKMQDQTSRLIKATTDMRDVAYSKGLTDDITNTRQQVRGIQDRLDNSNRNMGDLARQNDAMAADFKAIGKTLEAVTKSVNTNNSNLYWLYKNGLTVHTDDVTKSVSEEYKKVTGMSITEVINTNVVQELKKYMLEAKQASKTAERLAQTTINATKINIETSKQLNKSINTYLIEFAVILLLTIATPGPFKILTTIATTAVSYIFNKYIQSKGE